jgi:uncharacterized protein (UPF0218 family)
MPTEYSLTPELRTRLKQPLGTLIRGSFTETIRRFSELVSKEKTTGIISVGDTVSKNLARTHITAKLSIVDNKCMRKSVGPVMLPAEQTFYVKNPRGTITEESIMAIRQALKSDRNARIIVDGEEDLLALIAIKEAPENSFVLYGQPREGIVVVKVTSDKRAQVQEILGAMGKGSKN